MIANLTESIAMPSLRISALFFIVILISGLAGCGKTGALYLPDNQAKPAEQKKLLSVQAD